MQSNASIRFFDSQFARQAQAADLALNPFEIAALPHLRGRILDFGCGLGNLALAAARQGCSVLALDASPTAIDHLRQRAQAEALPIEAHQADLRDYALAEDFDAVVCIGLLMYFDRASALRQLRQLQARLRPGAPAIINVLVEGTTFTDMFDPASHYLFSRAELPAHFAGWQTLYCAEEDFAAPRDLRKSFVTLIARKPGP